MSEKVIPATYNTEIDIFKVADQLLAGFTHGISRVHEKAFHSWPFLTARRFRGLKSETVLQTPVRQRINTEATLGV